MEVIVNKSDVNNYSISEINYIRDNIESMNKFNQVEILRILAKHQNVILNENKYGIHVNLTELQKEILDELSMYIKYVNTQESNLNIIEQQKEVYRTTYFSEKIDENVNMSDIIENSE